MREAIHLPLVLICVLVWSAAAPLTGRSIGLGPLMPMYSDAPLHQESVETPSCQERLQDFEEVQQQLKEPLPAFTKPSNCHAVVDKYKAMPANTCLHPPMCIWNVMPHSVVVFPRLYHVLGLSRPLPLQVGPGTPFEKRSDSNLPNPKEERRSSTQPLGLSYASSRLPEQNRAEGVDAPYRHTCVREYAYMPDCRGIFQKHIALERLHRFGT